VPGLSQLYCNAEEGHRTMKSLRLTIGCEAYDRTAALASGDVQIEGCESIVLPLRAEELFLRTLAWQEFDVSEMSLSSYMIGHARGGGAYVALPIFPSRVFRHSAIYINSQSGIEKPEDLRGKTVGVPEYQMTAALWARGLLSDLYGVSASDMGWRTGGLEQPGRIEKISLRLPDSFDVKPIAVDQRLADLLATGEIDAIISARAPSCFGSQHNVRRLFPDYRAAERDYFKKTGIFPIMHVVVVRRTLVDSYPWLASALFKAFSEAKEHCLARLGEIGALAVTLPWLVAEYEETCRLMGPDFWPYGLAANEATLTAAIRHAHEQGLIEKPFQAKDMFAPGLGRDGSVHV